MNSLGVFPDAACDNLGRPLDDSLFHYLAAHYFNLLFERGYITFSLLAVASICILDFLFRGTDKLQYKILLILLMIVLAITITRLPARSGYLALAMLLPWICATMFGFKRIIPIFIFGLLLLALMFTSQKVQTRISEVSHEMERFQTSSNAELLKTSTALRFVMWQEAWKIFKDKPLLGAGTAGFQVEANRNRPGFGFSHPHNSYLYIVSTYGILGIIIYGWLLAVTLKRAWIARTRLSGHTMLAFLSVILIGGLTDTTFISPASGILLGFVVGIPTGTECASS
jgi:O-antigen ligase